MKQMTHTIIPAFSTPIYKNNINISGGVLKYIKELDYRPIFSNTGEISLDNYILNDNNLTDLKQTIEQQLDIYLRQELQITNNVDFYFLNSWVMKHTKGHYAPNHRHGNSIISGTLYLACDEQSGDLVFKKAAEITNLIPSCFSTEYNQSNILNSDVISFTPKPGDIFLFPSFLQHRVEESLSDNERYCLAFNLFIRGEFGMYDPEKIAILSI